MRDYLSLQMQSQDIDDISSLGLAHLGDAVYDLLVRSWLCEHGSMTSRRLHYETIRKVNAAAQARAFEKIRNLLTTEENAVFKRGRNTKVNTVPSRATVAQYHTATGLEALLGWLYLRGEKDRINELFIKMME